MNIRRAVITSALASFLAAATFGACGGPALEEVTGTKPYADLIGSEYRVLTDDVHAHGVYGEWPERTVTSVTVDRSTRFRGHEVAFRRRVQKGAVIRIVSAWRRSEPFGGSVHYRVAVTGAELPSDTPIELPLTDGNEGAGADLNPVVYRKLPGTTPR